MRSMVMILGLGGRLGKREIDLNERVAEKERKGAK